MNINDKNLQEAKKLNQQAKQGSFSNPSGFTSSNNSVLEETKKLNQQSKQSK